MLNLGPQESSFALSLVMLLFCVFGWRQTKFARTLIASIILAAVSMFVVNSGYKELPTQLLIWLVLGFAFMNMVGYAVGRLIYSVLASGRKRT